MVMVAAWNLIFLALLDWLYPRAEIDVAPAFDSARFVEVRSGHFCKSSFDLAHSYARENERENRAHCKTMHASRLIEVSEDPLPPSTTIRPDLDGHNEQGTARSHLSVFVKDIGTVAYFKCLTRLIKGALLRPALHLYVYEKSKRESRKRVRS